MGAFKFETIRPPAPEGGMLGCFKSEILEKERNASYAKGFKDGVSVTKDAVEIETNRLLSKINEDLSDIGFTNEQASSAVMKSLNPLITSIVSQIAPSVLHETLVERVQETIVDIAQDQTASKVEIAAPQALQESLASLIQTQGFDVTLCEDNALGDLEVRLNWNGGHDLLDMEQVRDTILSKIGEFMDCLSEEEDERRRQS